MAFARNISNIELKTASSATWLRLWKHVGIEVPAYRRFWMRRLEAASTVEAPSQLVYGVAKFPYRQSDIDGLGPVPQQPWDGLFQQDPGFMHQLFLNL